MDTLYTFWDNTTHYKTKSVHVFGLMNSATRENRGPEFLEHTRTSIPRVPKHV